MRIEFNLAEDIYWFRDLPTDELRAHLRELDRVLARSPRQWTPEVVEARGAVAWERLRVQSLLNRRGVAERRRLRPLTTDLATLQRVLQALDEALGEGSR